VRRSAAPRKSGSARCGRSRTGRAAATLAPETEGGSLAGARGLSNFFDLKAGARQTNNGPPRSWGGHPRQRLLGQDFKIRLGGSLRLHVQHNDTPVGESVSSALLPAAAPGAGTRQPGSVPGIREPHPTEPGAAGAGDPGREDVRLLRDGLQPDGFGSGKSKRQTTTRGCDGPSGAGPSELPAQWQRADLDVWPGGRLRPDHAGHHRLQHVLPAWETLSGGTRALRWSTSSPSRRTSSS